jgi:hypothetical protein
MVNRIQYAYCNVDLMLVYYLFISLLFFFPQNALSLAKWKQKEGEYKLTEMLITV